MRLLIMGPQGVGKGTQAKLLAEHYGIPTISTGDIFRANIKNKTELGKKVLEYTSQGFLVPDELTNEIVRDRLAQDDAKNGWILDGYPRNVAQVSALDEILEGLGEQLDAVVALTAPTNVLLERMAKRAKEEGRADDTPEAIQNRLNTHAGARHLPAARQARHRERRGRDRCDQRGDRQGTRCQAWLNNGANACREVCGIGEHGIIRVSIR